MNNICDALEVKLITHYLLALNKRLYEAALNCSVLVIICLLWEAVNEAQATQACPEMRRLSGLGGCPSSPHGGPPPGALQSTGSRAELLYFPSEIQMSATVSQPHRMRKLASIWSLKLPRSTSTAHGILNHPLNFKETKPAQSFLLDLASPMQCLFLTWVSVLHLEISSTFLIPLECPLPCFLSSS